MGNESLFLNTQLSARFLRQRLCGPAAPPLPDRSYAPDQRAVRHEHNTKYEEPEAEEVENILRQVEGMRGIAEGTSPKPFIPARNLDGRRDKHSQAGHQHKASIFARHMPDSRKKTKSKQGRQPRHHESVECKSLIELPERQAWPRRRPHQVPRVEKNQKR